MYKIEPGGNGYFLINSRPYQRGIYEPIFTDELFGIRRNSDGNVLVNPAKYDQWRNENNQVFTSVLEISKYINTFFFRNIIPPIVTDKTSIITAPTITADVSNYNPDGFQKNGDGVILVSQINIASNSNSNEMTGLKAPNPALQIRVTIFNKGDGTNISGIKARAEDTRSLPTNRFYTDVDINYRNKLVFEYDTTLLRWTRID